MLELSRLKKLALGVIALNETQNRRSITTHEYTLFDKYLHMKFDFVDGWYHEEAQREVHEYFDEINLKGETIYRLRPDKEISDLREKIVFLPLDLIKIASIPEATANLTDLTAEDEQTLPEFKINDEKHELKAIYEIYRLEKAKREAEAYYHKITKNTNSVVDYDIAEALLDEGSTSLEALSDKYLSL